MSYRYFYHLQLFVIVLALSTTTVVVSAYPNVALNMPTEQVFFPGANPDGSSSNAVDGNTNADMHAGSCINTGNGTGWHWWIVNLGAVHAINGISITHRNDCCSDQLRNITIELTQSHPRTYSSFPAAKNLKSPIEIVPTRGTFNINFKRKNRCPRAQYVRVIMESTGSPMTFCEVQVFGQQVNMDDDGNINLAYAKPTKQMPHSKNVDSIKASMQLSRYAVDGNRIQNIYHGTCSNTGKKKGWHWWLVDLRDVYIIDYIRLSSRGESKCCLDRLSNFTVEASVDYPENLNGFPKRTSASICLTRIEPVPIQGRIKYKCDKPVEGRYVRIVKYSTKFKGLTICEFEAFGHLKHKYGEERKAWIFEKVNINDYQFDDQDVERKTMNCMRQRLRLMAGSTRLNYVSTGLPAGDCKFFETLFDFRNNGSSDALLHRLQHN